MVGLHKLEKGTWYDGFVFRRGKQVSVATLQWNGEDFANPKYKTKRLYHRDGTPKMPGFGMSNWFEPNTRGVDPNEESK